MKNCTLEAKSIVSLLEQANSDKEREPYSSRSSISSNNLSGIRLATTAIFTDVDVKNISFRLKNYLSVDIFAEEFISYEGIKKLIDIIEITSGNTRVYNIVKYY